MQQWTRGSLGLLIALALAACDGGGGPTPTGLPPDASPTPTAPGPGPPIITYEKQGGVAGLWEGVQIWPDGRARITQRGVAGPPMSLPPARLSALLTQFADARFTDLDAQYGSPTVADDFQYTISLTQGKNRQKVRFYAVAGKAQTPPALYDLAAALAGVPAELQPSSTPAVPAFSPTPPPGSNVEPGAGADLLSYRVQGGIAGLDTALFVDYQRRAHYYQRGTEIGTAQLPPERIAALRAQFAQADFLTLADAYRAAVLPADGQTITVTYNAGDRIKTVVVQDGATGVPAAWSPLVGELAKVSVDYPPAP